MTEDINAIGRQFAIDGAFVSSAPYGSGHINDTHVAVYESGHGCTRYIVQRVNRNVFKDVPALMDNVVRVTEHLRDKLSQHGAADVARRTLTVVPTRDGASYYRDLEGEYWRVYVFIENAHTHDVLESPRQAYQAAKAYGGFQRMLADLPAPALHETIPNFHSGPKRFEAFEEMLRADTLNRAKQAEPEIELLYRYAPIFEVLPAQIASGAIPLRTTHNDTKINNVMLDDETGEGVCVIDLDTVMPGLSLYDFGDMVRTSTGTAAEDEQDLAKVGLDRDRFRALLAGYLESAGAFLNEAERNHLITGSKMIVLTIGTRFLTDFLAGDCYFRIHREGHNLDRCRTQFRLVELLVEAEDDLQALVAEAIAQPKDISA